MSLQRSQLRVRLLLAIKLAIVLVVLAGISYTVWNAIQDVKDSGFSLAAIDLRWIAVGAVAYVLGTIPCWLFWHQTLHAMGQSPHFWETFRAYYIGHIGKYVPGKAMVVVLRTSWIRSDRTDTTVAAVSIFVETLTMMAVGAFMSAAIMCVFYRDHIPLLLLAVGLMLLSGLPTLPPICRRLVRWLQVKRANPDIERALAGLNYRLMIQGWMMISVGWVVLGAGLWSVLSAIPGAQPKIGDLPLLIACAALAMVAGFLSLIPGGLGVREWVTVELLRNGLGYSYLPATVSAVLLRLAWLLAEVVVLVILYVSSWVKKPSVTPSHKTQS